MQEQQQKALREVCDRLYALSENPLDKVSFYIGFKCATEHLAPLIEACETLVKFQKYHSNSKAFWTVCACEEALAKVFGETK